MLQCEAQRENRCDWWDREMAEEERGRQNVSLADLNTKPDWKQRIAGAGWGVWGREPDGFH
jgi:hypothetical protein